MPRHRLSAGFVTLMLVLAVASLAPPHTVAAPPAPPAPTAPAAAPTSPLPASVTDLDTLLRWEDREVLARFQRTCLMDLRYSKVLNRAADRLNPCLAAVFGPEAARTGVNYYVFVGHMGFNAQTWYRLVIIDTLLLDGLHHLAQGVAVHGSVVTPYVQNLAVAVARAHAACRTGSAAPDWGNPRNPYNLPAIWGLDPAQRDEAASLFEEMVAFWLAHEVSHALLEHAREQVAAAEELADPRHRASVPPEVLARRLARYVSYEVGRQKELQADEKAAQLILKAGYGITGVVRSLEFAQYLEELAGPRNAALRTHPLAAERLQLVRSVAASLQKK